MSTSVEVSSGGMASPVEGDDAYVDDPRLDKKKKFKPFQKMRNFFRGSSKKRFKPDESGGQKAHSTGALHHQGDSTEEDDDGGFRSKTLGLAGSRSISEDSIFKTETKEPTPGVLENKTVSMEYIDKSPFQSELFAKLRSRQSDSDIDEGLPYSPLTTLTHHGLMFDTSRKSVPAAGKSTSQESEQSLISVDGSDEDLFSSNWRSGVASVKTRSASLDSLPENQMDFEVVQVRSTSLSNEAAKHRISVKPKARRLSAKMSIKRRERSPAPPSLADVKEETPPQPQQRPETQEPKQPVPHKTVISTTIPVGSPSETPVGVIQRSEPKDIPGHSGVTLRNQVKDIARSEPENIPHGGRQSEERSRPRSLSPLSTSPVSQSMLQEVKLRKRPVSGKFDGEEVKKESEGSGNELAKAFDRAKRISKKFDDDGNVVEVGAKQSVKVHEKETEVRKQQNTKFGTEVKKESVSSPVKSSPVSPPVSSPTSGISFVLKKEPLRPGSTRDSQKNTSNTSTDTPKSAPIEPKVTITETPKSVTISTSGVSEKPKDSEVSKMEGEQKQGTAKAGSPEKLASPKEEYKLKRAARSKTLPVSKDIIDKAEDSDKKIASSRLGSPPLGGRKTKDLDTVETELKSVNMQSKRASWASPSATTANSTEPPWVVRAKLKQLEQEQKPAGDKVDATKDIKADIKSTSETVKSINSETDTRDKNAADKVNEQKIDIPKGTVQASGVKSWAQSYSAKPFEKVTVSKPNTGVGKASDKTGVVQSVKPPTPVEVSKSEVPATSTPIVAVSASSVSSSNPKSMVSSSTKPTISAGSKPPLAAAAASKPAPTTSKPSVPGVSKPAFSTATKPAVSGFTKPSTAASKSPVSVTSASSNDKSTPLSSKTAVTVSSSSQSSKPVGTVASSSSVDKPLSQSLRQTGFSSVPSTNSNNFSRSFTAKSITETQKIGQDAKPLSHSPAKPVNVSKDSASKPVTISSISKTSSLDNKKADNDLKNENKSSSTLKSGSSFDKSKSAFGTATKPDSGSAVPAWKQALNQRKNSAGSQQVKIEIIDKDKKTPQKKVEEKPATVQIREKPEKFADVSSNKASKVLDMVKSFQKLQVT